MCMSVSSKAIALVFSFTAVLALIVSSQPSLASPDNLTLLLPSANVSVSAPAFKPNLNLDFLSRNGVINDAQPVCNDMFGTNLNMQSCYDALNGIHDDTVPRSFGDRGHSYDVQLPRRMISPDGTCVIDIFHKDGAEYDYSNNRQILTAAASVVFQCVRENQNYMGGYVRDIGSSQNLVIVVSGYKPAVTCYGPVGAAWTASQALIDMLPTTYNEQVFAPVGTPGAEVILPKTYTQPRSAELLTRFYVNIRMMRGSAVTGRWFDLWAAAVAINILCVKNGRAGRATVEGGLLVRVDRQYGKPGEVVSGSSNSSSFVDIA